jgi:hypothetical protein
MAVRKATTRMKALVAAVIRRSSRKRMVGDDGFEPPTLSV